MKVFKSSLIGLVAGAALLASAAAFAVKPSEQVTIKFMEAVSGDVRWSPDGLCVAAGCRRGIRIWDARRGYELCRPVIEAADPVDSPR